MVLENIGNHSQLVLEYCEAVLDACDAGEVAKWPYSDGCRKALVRLCIACGAKPGEARNVAGKASLKRLIRIASRLKRDGK